MKTTRTWIALAIGTLAGLATSYGAYTLANWSWNQVVDYRSPYAKVALPPTAPGSPFDRLVPRTTSPRVVLVIVDGLREDVSRKMPAINALRDSGFDAVVVTGQPSLSFPNWTTLLSGAGQRFSGVTTNWFKERVPVETLVDVAVSQKATTVVSAPTDFETLYGVERTGHTFLRDWEEGVYMSAGIVDNAIRLSEEASPTLVIVHLPDIDEAGHAFGGASKQYLETALKVDGDIARLVQALKDERTAFVVASDHGHIDTGGHGGWEPEVIEVPAVFAGDEIVLGTGTGSQEQVAPSIALLAGLPAPRNATALPLPVKGMLAPSDDHRFNAQLLSALTAYTSVVENAPPRLIPTVVGARAALDAADDTRAAAEAVGRLPVALAIAGVAVAVLVVIGLLSWRVLVSALGGAAGYYLLYNGLFFWLHGYKWSLSAFNSESLLSAFFNGRMLEAALSGLFAAFVAGDVYLATRREPQRPKGEHLPGWLALGTATVLVVQATLALQVAWFWWRWGAFVTWKLPDFEWAFKYDLDLIQTTALGAALVVAPLLTYLVGRFHPLPKPRVAPASEE